ncbi:cyclic nucleotide-binding domain-containing protein [Algoriphagus aestuariicola]|uniref:histidine kinase n=1 Tax=Algoriphagus aestuariicola TaxID=1852016 RepID=A0ABS3BVR8_9BACT|nr:ATP-binding protein [Algoriphagus aestuariicola]MBN7803165.1 cyclic nucleotide-binding domain-containing protein [Algoriphagus aestuariicola]
MGNDEKKDFERLRLIPDFHEVPDAQLDWLLQNSHSIELQKGDFLFQPNTPSRHLHIVLSGALELYVLYGSNKRTLNHFDKGSTLGQFPLLKETEFTAYCQASLPSRILSFPISEFQNLLTMHEELTEALVSSRTTKPRKVSFQTLQNQKLISLGKLTAGLSHELNHPINSIQRDSAELNRIFSKGGIERLLIQDSELNERDQSLLKDAVSGWMHQIPDTTISSVEIQQVEKQWLKRLIEWGMKNPSDAAEVFTDTKVDPEELEDWLKKIKPALAETWLTGLQQLLQSQLLVTNISIAAERIKELIQTVKSFSRIDRETTQRELDLVSEIRDTLSLLQHKIKAIKAKVIFPQTEGPILIHGSGGELNQVWTNLIANALDAMEAIPNPQLQIRIRRENSQVSVKITDNGSGIPEDILFKIFDPFFTTKGLGKGTGLGLDLVRQIVEKHGGEISVESKTGETTFDVRLPLG